MRTTKIIGILVLITLTSCEGSTDKEWLFRNNSSEHVTLRTYSGWNDDTVTTSIPPGAAKIFLTSSQKGGNSNPSDLKNEFSYFSAFQNSGKNLIKSHEFESNWLISIEEVRKMPSQYEHSYIFEVTDADFN